MCKKNCTSWVISKIAVFGNLSYDSEHTWDSIGRQKMAPAENFCCYDITLELIQKCLI